MTTAIDLRGADKSYAAFISYRRDGDQPLAKSLQFGLQRLAKPWYRARAALEGRPRLLSVLDPVDEALATSREETRTVRARSLGRRPAAPTTIRPRLTTVSTLDSPLVDGFGTNNRPIFGTDP